MANCYVTDTDYRQRWFDQPEQATRVYDLWLKQWVHLWGPIPFDIFTRPNPRYAKTEPQ